MVWPFEDRCAEVGFPPIRGDSNSLVLLSDRLAHWNIFSHSSVLARVYHFAKGTNPMNQLLARGKTLLFLLLLSIAILQAHAQSPQKTTTQDELTRTVTSLDSALFDAYNQCDLEKFGTFFIDEVEFYHDQGGVTLGRQNLTESVKKNICGKVRRELVPGTLEVYPMHGYGAVEMGVHRFHQPKVDPIKPVGEAKFIHLWQNKDGVWKITRVISYDHQSLRK
jgi:hypothetical protein